MLRSRRMTSLTSRNPRQKYVARLRTAQRFFMAARARKSPVRIMIEFRVRHPLHRRSRWFHNRQITLSRSHRERMALFASLPPQKFFRISDLRSDPLIRRIHSHSRLHQPFPSNRVPGSRTSRNSPGCAAIYSLNFFTRNACTTSGLSCGTPSLEPLVKRQRMASRARRSQISPAPSIRGHSRAPDAEASRSSAASNSSCSE